MEGMWLWRDFIAWVSRIPGLCIDWRLTWCSGQAPRKRCKSLFVESKIRLSSQFVTLFAYTFSESCFQQWSLGCVCKGAKFLTFVLPWPALKFFNTSESFYYHDLVGHGSKWARLLERLIGPYAEHCDRLMRDGCIAGGWSDTVAVSSYWFYRRVNSEDIEGFCDFLFQASIRNISRLFAGFLYSTLLWTVWMYVCLISIGICYLCPFMFYDFSAEVAYLCESLRKLGGSWGTKAYMLFNNFMMPFPSTVAGCLLMIVERITLFISDGCWVSLFRNCNGWKSQF